MRRSLQSFWMKQTEGISHKKGKEENGYVSGNGTVRRKKRCEDI